MNILLQITSGRGPIECCWVVAQVLKYLIEDAKKQAIEHLILHREAGIENGTLISATIQLSGIKAEVLAQQWTGTILWVGQSQFRKNHKRKNWYIGIKQLDMSSNTYSVEEKDIQYQAIRSGGPGGQHVNKVSSAVRAKHVPTGLHVLVSESRSQHQNKKLAKERLLGLIQLEQLNAQKRDIKSGWQNHTQLQRGNPVKTFFGTDFKSNFNSKKFKSKRLALKNNLRRQPLE